MRTQKRRAYKPTEAKFKGGAIERYVAYDLEQRTRSGRRAIYPKVKRVYIAGDVTGWKSAARLRKRSGRVVKGIRIEYRQSRRAYARKAYTAKRGRTRYQVKPSRAPRTEETFTQIVELPEKARNAHFYPASSRLPPKYKHALQRVR
jgi:hypothetical protein